MSGSNQTIWEGLQSKVRGGPQALSIWIIGVLAVLCAFSFNWEDAVSSYQGILSLEQSFGVQAVGSDWVRYTMAVAPQVGQIVFLTWYSLTGSKWALVGLTCSFVLDFVSDVQFRSNNTFIPLGGGSIKFDKSVWVSMAMTFVYFTVGAELLLVAGSAIVLTLFADAVREAYRLRYAVRDAIEDAKRGGRSLNRSNSGRGGNQGQRPQQNRNQGQRPQQNRTQGQRQAPPATPGNAMDMFMSAMNDDD